MSTFGDTEIRQVQNLTKTQNTILEKLLKQIKGEVGEGVEAYPGDIAPGLGNTLKQLVDFARSYQDSELYRGSESVLNRALTADPDYESTRSYWQDAFVDPAMQMFERDILPAIRERNVGQGTFMSGGRHRAETGAAGDLMTNLTGQLANLMYGERQNTLNRAMQAVPQSESLQGTAANLLGTVGGMERGVKAEQMAEDYNKWGFSRPYANPWLQLLPTALGTQATTPYLYEEAPSTLGTLAQTGIGALGGGLGMGLGKLLGGGSSLWDAGKSLFGF
jgi:hypothetical protein